MRKIFLKIFLVIAFGVSYLTSQAQCPIVVDSTKYYSGDTLGAYLIINCPNVKFVKSNKTGLIYQKIGGQWSTGNFSNGIDTVALHYVKLASKLNVSDTIGNYVKYRTPSIDTSALASDAQIAALEAKKLNASDTVGNYVKYYQAPIDTALLASDAQIAALESKKLNSADTVGNYALYYQAQATVDTNALHYVKLANKLNTSDTIGNYVKYYQAPVDTSLLASDAQIAALESKKLNKSDTTGFYALYYQPTIDTSLLASDAQIAALESKKLNKVDTTGNYALYYQAPVDTSLLASDAQILSLENKKLNLSDTSALHYVKLSQKLNATDTVGNFVKYYQAPVDTSSLASDAQVAALESKKLNAVDTVGNYVKYYQTPGAVIQALTDGASISWNGALGAYATLSLSTANAVLQNITNPVSGRLYVLTVRNTGSTQYLYFGTKYQFNNSGSIPSGLPIVYGSTTLLITYNASDDVFVIANGIDNTTVLDYSVANSSTVTLDNGTLINHITSSPLSNVTAVTIGTPLATYFTGLEGNYKTLYLNLKANNVDVTYTFSSYWKENDGTTTMLPVRVKAGSVLTYQFLCNSAQGLNVETVSSNAYVTQALAASGSATHWNSVVTMNNPFTTVVTLPTVTINDIGKTITVKNINVGVCTQTSADAIQGNLSLAQFESVTFVATGIGVVQAIGDKLNSVSVPTTQVVTGTTTLTSWNRNIELNITANTTITIPTVVGNTGRTLSFVRKDATAFTVSIVANGAEVLTMQSLGTELNTKDGAITITAIDATNARQTANIGTAPVLSEGGTTVLTTSPTTIATGVNSFATSSSLMTFVIPSTGVYIANLSIRGYTNNVANNSVNVAIADPLGVLVPNSEILSVFSSTTTGISGNGSGTVRFTALTAGTYTVKVWNTNNTATAQIFSDANGRSTVNWDKVGGFMPIGGYITNFWQGQATAPTVATGTTDVTVYTKKTGNIADPSAGVFTLSTAGTYKLSAFGQVSVAASGSSFQLVWADNAGVTLAANSNTQQQVGNVGNTTMVSSNAVATITVNAPTTFKLRAITTTITATYVTPILISIDQMAATGFTDLPVANGTNFVNTSTAQAAIAGDKTFTDNTTLGSATGTTTTIGNSNGATSINMNSGATGTFNLTSFNPTGTAIGVANNALTSGFVLGVNSSSAARLTNSVGLNVAVAGALTTASQTTRGARINNTSTGTTSTNIGLEINASGATNNYGLIVPNGSSAFGLSVPLSTVDVLGNTFLRGANTITPLTPVSAVELFTGRSSANALFAGQTTADIAIQGGSAGGYRHFIATRHNNVASSNQNSIDFYLNNSVAVGGSSAPGTGNVNGMSITATGIGVLTNAPTSTATINGSISLPFTNTGTTALTVTASMYVINCNNGATAIAVNLPTPVGITGRIYIVKRDLSSTGSVNITPAAGSIQAFAGTFGATTTLGALGSTSKAMMFMSDGINWHLIN